MNRICVEWHVAGNATQLGEWAEKTKGCGKQKPPPISQRGPSVITIGSSRLTPSPLAN